MLPELVPVAFIAVPVAAVVLLFVLRRYRAPERGALQQLEVAVSFSDGVTYRARVALSPASRSSAPDADVLRAVVVATAKRFTSSDAAASPERFEEALLGALEPATVEGLRVELYPAS